MYAKSTRPSAKREVKKERSAKRDDRIARPRRAQTCELRAKRAMRMCPRSGQILILTLLITLLLIFYFFNLDCLETLLLYFPFYRLFSNFNCFHFYFYFCRFTTSSPDLFSITNN